MKLIFQYYLLMFFLFIIFESNIYNKKTIHQINNIKIIYNTYKDYLSWKEGERIKKKYISLSINTLYNHNTLKKENIEFLSLPYFHQEFNNKNYLNILFIPNINFFIKNYLSKKDISYFDVKTPTTQIFYETSLYGQLIQTIFTHSPNKNMNYSIHYQLLSPSIKYKDPFSTNNYFLTTFNYHDIENKYYKIWIHYINDEIQNIKKIPIVTPTNNLLNIKRWYIGQYLNIKKNIYLLDRLEYEKKIFIYKEKQDKNFFGNVYINEPRQNINYYDKIFHELSIKYFFHKKNIFTYGIAYYKLIYHPLFNKIKIQKNIFSLFGNFKFLLLNKSNINLYIKYFLVPNYDKIYYIFLQTKYNISFYSKIESRLLIANISPYFIINSNFYKKNNYLHHFNNITIKQLYLNSINKYINIYLNIYYINNYINFSLHKSPKQYSHTLELIKLSFYKLFIINKMKYNIFLQIHNNNIIHLPNVILRSCLYYENKLLNRKILFQAGIVLKYFIQNIYKEYNLKMEGLTFIDYFINIEFFRIKIYFLAQNFNIYKFFTQNKLSSDINTNKEYFIKIGLLWNMFT